MQRDNAIESLKELISSTERFRNQSTSPQEFFKWMRDARVTIKHIFGSHSEHIKYFEDMSFSSLDYRGLSKGSAFYRTFISGLDKSKELLESMIEEIEEC